MSIDASNLLDAARWYRGRGYAPIPLPAGDKKPVIRGWNTLRLSEDDLPRHFNGTGNIGLLLGEPSGWLVDVDLDCEEAVELAEQYLPPTGAVTGRPSRPGSHRWYVCERAATVKHKDPASGEMLVEKGLVDLPPVDGQPPETPMHKYAIQLTAADARDGALSGSTLREACSWGKVDVVHEQMVFGEVTTLFPLIASDAYHRGAWKKRPERRLSELFAAARV